MLLGLVNTSDAAAAPTAVSDGLHGEFDMPIAELMEDKTYIIRENRA